MTFAIFDENYYLSKNIDVATAVKAGIFQSGKQHFELYGLQEKRTSVSPIWSEGGYFGFGFIPRNFDVAQAVFEGNLPSGLAHFIQYGEAEGRFISNSSYNEEFYLRTNPDVANAVATKILPSGFSHFLQFGKNEGRKGSAFNEKAYLVFNPDVLAAVQSGAFLNSLEHYQQYGQGELRRGFFSGSSGNDVVSAFDSGYSTIAGVGIDVITGEPANIVPTSLGVGEIDTLIGSDSSYSDIFLLGVGRNAINPNGQKFYVGQGDADYAVISVLDLVGGDIISPGTDLIQLAGKPEDYVIQKADNSYQTKIFAITHGSGGSTPQLDLVAIVNANELSVVNVDPLTDTFTLSQPRFSPPPSPFPIIIG